MQRWIRVQEAQGPLNPSLSTAPSGVPADQFLDPHLVPVEKSEKRGEKRLVQTIKRLQ